MNPSLSLMSRSVAVFIAGTLVFSPIPGLASVVSVTQGTAAEAPDDEKPLNILAAKLDVDSADSDIKAEAAQVRRDMADRFFRFMTSGGDEPTFVTAGAKEDAGGGLKALTRKWVEDTFAAGSPYAGKAPVAELYFVLGAGTSIDDDGEALPSWAENHTVLKDNLDGFNREVLVTNMGRWTENAEADPANPGDFAVGRLGTTKHDEWSVAFLADAADAAHKIIADPRSREEKVDSILANEETGDVPVLPGAGGGVVGQARKFTLENLYEGGAEHVEMYQEGDAVRRKISMKAVTVRTADGLEERISICDYTFKRDIFCQSFPITYHDFSQTEALDDRVEGKMKYTLKMVPTQSGVVNITFGRPGNSEQITTSLAELYRLRARQAVGMGLIREVGGKNFYVLGQGYHGAVLYFPVDIKDKINKGDPVEELVPARLVSTRKSMRTKGRADLGKIGGTHFHAAYDSETRQWDIREGVGDYREIWDPSTRKFIMQTYNTEKGEWESPAPPADPETGNDQSGTGSTGPTGPTAPEGSFEEIEQRVFARMPGMYAPDMALNNALSEELKKTHKLYKITAKGIEFFKNDPNLMMRHYFIIGPTSVLQTRNAPAPFLLNRISEIKSIAIIQGKYLKTVSDLGTLYVDLTAKDLVPERYRFKPQGWLLDAGEIPVFSQWSNKELFGDALVQAGFTAAQKTAAIANLATVSVGVEDFLIFGRRDESLTFKAEEGTREFWPDIKEYRQSDGTHAETEGSGTAFETANGGPEADIMDRVTVGAGETAETLVVFDGLKTANAALYVNGVEKGEGTADKPRKWFLKYKYKNQDKIYLSVAKLVFTEGSNDGFDFPYDASPKVQINSDGVTAHSATEELGSTQSTVRFVAESATAARGVKAAFKTAGKDNVRDKKANCLAPIVWWGMDKAAAQKACEEDSY